MNTQKWFRDQPDPLVRVEVGVTRIQVRGPCIQIGDYLAQIKAMRLTYVQTFDPNVWRPNRVLSALQIDSIISAAQIEKWSFFMCICIISQETTILAQIRR